MQAIAIGSKPKSFYQILGKLLATQRPEIAKELVQQIQDSTPQVTDVSKIKKFLTTFCTSQNISIAYFTFSRYQTDAVEKRKLFLATILQLYAPGCFEHVENLNQKRRKLFSTLIDVMNTDYGNISKMARESIMLYKVYDDFKSQVDQTVNLFNQSISTIDRGKSNC